MIAVHCISVPTGTPVLAEPMSLCLKETTKPVGQIGLNLKTWENLLIQLAMTRVIKLALWVMLLILTVIILPTKVRIYIKLY